MCVRACARTCVVQVLACVDDLHRDGIAADIHAALQTVAAGLGHNWRAAAALACALPALPGLLHNDALADVWVPHAFTLLLHGECGQPAAH